MFNLGAGEIVVIVVAALLLLGPKRLPEMARGIGKFVREFRRQTDEVRTVVEREFYRMDQEFQAPVVEELPAHKPPAVPPSQPAPQLSAPAEPAAAATEPLEPVILPPVPGTVAKPRGMPAPAAVASPVVAPEAAAEPPVAPVAPAAPSRQE
ncbi:MAG TPA: twin-arginine translocase TatA/TatE family subunit [Myxococcaceae bacterium]|nr:twin-arginine translocase TatA/TatE family subunit [Myxococcaceae bacterium]